MPYVIPTTAMFHTRFPIFEGVDDDLIQMLLTEASDRISTDWAVTDYQPAILYLTAHLLATDNSGEGETVTIGSAGGTAIKSESMGGLSISYGGDTANARYSNSAYGSTEYGRRYLDLLWLNFGDAVLVV